MPCMQCGIDERDYCEGCFGTALAILHDLAYDDDNGESLRRRAEEFIEQGNAYRELYDQEECDGD